MNKKRAQYLISFRLKDEAKYAETLLRKHGLMFERGYVLKLRRYIFKLSDRAGRIAVEALLAERRKSDSQIGSFEFKRVDKNGRTIHAPKNLKTRLSLTKRLEQAQRAKMRKRLKRLAERRAISPSKASESPAQKQMEQTE